jgi:hypothetical protein
MLATKLRFIWLNGFRGEDFLEINQSPSEGSVLSFLKAE